MTGFFSLVGEWFRVGGPVMWVLLFFSACAAAIIAERFIFLYFICPKNYSGLLNNVKKAVGEDKIEDAIKFVSGRLAPTHVLLAVALQSFKEGSSISDIQENVEEAAIHQIHRFSVRINYLTLFANVATLVGLLGTITGLMISFSSLANVEAAQKAAMLAAGISQAMITTAFGLIVAVPCMVVYTIYSNRQTRLVKDLDESVVKLINFMKKKRPA
ncbi:MAG: MotA/TolQ/ExbB proton channel family protein [Chitinispirillales bacterium]|jgi:biopolymer transport protein ExbB/TolQ|nr:MotA/TolQ/ExbB proton channel family protein [Chitinispirillales bacterium]